MRPGFHNSWKTNKESPMFLLPNWLEGKLKIIFLTSICLHHLKEIWEVPYHEKENCCESKQQKKGNEITHTPSYYACICIHPSHFHYCYSNKNSIKMNSGGFLKSDIKDYFLPYNHHLYSSLTCFIKKRYGGGIS